MVRNESEDFFQKRVLLASSVLRTKMRTEMRYKDLKDKVKDTYRTHYAGLSHHERVLLLPPSQLVVSDHRIVDLFIRHKAEDHSYELLDLTEGEIHDLWLRQYLMDYKTSLVQCLTNTMGRATISYDDAIAFYMPACSSPMARSSTFAYESYTEAYHLSYGISHWRRDDVAINCAAKLLCSLYHLSDIGSFKMDEMRSKGSIFLCVMCDNSDRELYTWEGLVRTFYFSATLFAFALIFFFLLRFNTLLVRSNTIIHGRQGRSGELFVAVSYFIA